MTLSSYRQHSANAGGCCYVTIETLIWAEVKINCAWSTINIRYTVQMFKTEEIKAVLWRQVSHTHIYVNTTQKRQDENGERFYSYSDALTQSKLQVSQLGAQYSVSVCQSVLWHTHRRSQGSNHHPYHQWTTYSTNWAFSPHKAAENVWEVLFLVFTLNKWSTNHIQRS